MKKENIKNKFSFLKGLGSVINIWPNTDYSEFMDKRPIEKRIAGYWGEAGRHLNNAINDFEKGNQNEKNTKDTNPWDRYYR